MSLTKSDTKKLNRLGVKVEPFATASTPASLAAASKAEHRRAYARLQGVKVGGLDAFIERVLATGPLDASAVARLRGLQNFKAYTVVGFYRESGIRFTNTVSASSPEDAEASSEREHCGLEVVATFAGSLTPVL